MHEAELILARRACNSSASFIIGSQPQGLNAY